MSIYSVSTSLVGSPTLRYGFWYSYGTTQISGHMLTVTNFWATYLALALGLLVGWAVSRLWRIGCAVLFYFSYTPKPSWEESQNNVFIVNSKSALDGCIDSYVILKGRTKAYRRYGRGHYNALRGNKSPRYRRAKYVVIFAMLVGFITIGLNLAVPLLIALVPLTKLGIAVPGDCGNVSLAAIVGPNAPMSDPRTFELTSETDIRRNRWANAAFGTLDGTMSYQLDDSGSYLPGKERTALPEPEISMNYSCPAAVSACSTQHPFTFSSQYTLLPQHFGLNVIPFSLRVSESCYRPSGTIVPLTIEYINSTTLPLPSPPANYGPFNWTSDPAAASNFTMLLNPALLNGPYYNLEPRNAAANQPPGNGWSPYANVTQGGDTAILLYYLGLAVMTNQSSDPLFATGVPWGPPGKLVYYHESAVVPIICDTKYVFCDGHSSDNDCSTPGGFSTLLDWFEGRQGNPWTDLGNLSSALLYWPPIYTASLGSNSILASQSAEGYIQYAPGNATILRELSRLSRAGMAILASYAQLSVAGYLKNTEMEATLALESDPYSLCNNVVMELSTVTTIPVIPYLLFVLLSSLIVALSYSSAFPLPKRIFFSSFDRLFNIWGLHLPGQLHREVAEKLRGRNFKSVSMIDSWPATPYQSGPTVITKDGAERFSSGSTGLLENMEEDTEEYPLDTHRLA